uniref:Uncharacterized protein n=1 Tax=Anguilla anguilla TaxID=7936 RepID=A0A0E9UZP2_ANGAN
MYIMCYNVPWLTVRTGEWRINCCGRLTLWSFLLVLVLGQTAVPVGASHFPLTVLQNPFNHELCTLDIFKHTYEDILKV